jgi:hypothetical protein
MAKVIRSEEVLGHLQKPGSSPQRSYILRFNQLPFGFLYVSWKYYTIAWPGPIDFALLEQIALESLSDAILAGRRGVSRMAKPTNKSTNVSLIISDPADSTEKLEKFYLGNPEELHTYKKILQTPYNVIFARYDIKHAYSGTRLGQSKMNFFTYSFTAENPDRTKAFENELAIKLDKRERFSEQILDFILKNHYADTDFKSDIIKDESVSHIQNLVYSMR